MPTTDPVYATLPEAAVVAELATRSAGPHRIGDSDLYAVALPEGGQLQLVDLVPAQELRADRPPRRKGTAHTYDADSFSALVTDLGARDGVARIYASPDDLGFTAVLNDDDTGGGDPGWRDHLVVFALGRTRSWQGWIDGQGLRTQEEFAEHIEDHRADIADPPAADMLELAQTIQATIGAKFSGGARLHNGERHASYVEEVQGSAGRAGQMAIPEAMTLRVVPFDGNDPVEVEARIRFRIRDGRLAIGYSLHRADEIERQAFDAVRARIENGTGMLTVSGSPAA